jgi:hypothetical protein
MTVSVDDVGIHVMGAGLTATSIAGVLGYVPIVVAVIAGVMAIVSYTFATLDSPTFKSWFGPKSNPPK